MTTTGELMTPSCHWGTSRCSPSQTRTSCGGAAPGLPPGLRLASPATSALDCNCRAHDLDNLYVVDTSFFPSSSAVNPALTAMANALRVGDHLLERLDGSGVVTQAMANGNAKPVEVRS